MDPLASFLGIAALLATAVIAGLLLRRRRGSSREINGATRLDAAIFGIERFGERGTIVQFSTEYCARCPVIHRYLTELVSTREGIEFTHIDLTHNVELARQFHVLQTPTLLFIDAEGRPVKRLSGQLSQDSIRSAVDAFAPSTIQTGASA